MIRSRGLVAAIVVLGTLYATPSAAQEPNAGGEDMSGLEALLDESVVTTASRTAERASAAPSSVYTITREQLFTFGIQSIDEALLFLGIGVYTSVTRDYSTGIDVGAQGALLRDGGRHILALLDGHTMNSQITGAISINEAFGVPLNLIDHIEVMLGAGSVMYGSSAMLLVVNVVTRRAQDFEGVHATAELGTAAPHGGDNVIGGASADRWGFRYLAGVTGGKRWSDDLDLLVSAQWLEDYSNDYAVEHYAGSAFGGFSVRAGDSSWGGPAHHRMRAPSGMVALRYRDFQLKLQANYYERGMPAVGVFQHPDAAEQQHALRFDLRHRADLSSHLSFDSRLYGDSHRFSERTYWTDVWCPEAIEECQFQRSATANWLGLEERMSIDWRLDGNLTTMVGVDLRGRHTHMQPGDYARFDGSELEGYRSPLIERNGFLGALFAQQVWKPTHWLTLNLGARLDADTDFGLHLSPRAAATVEPVADTVVRGSYSESFRGPTPMELEDHDNFFRIPPRGLDAETVRVVELELQQRLQIVTLSVRAFAMFFEQMIQSRPATQADYERALEAGQVSTAAEPSVLIVYDNLATIQSYGFSPSLSLRFSSSLRGTLTFNYAHSQLQGRPLAVMPAAYGNLQLAWQPVPNGLTLAAAAFLSGNRNVTSWDVPTPAKLGPELDLKGTLSGPIGPKGLSFRLSLTYAHNPYVPYTPIAIGTEAPGERLFLLPVVTRLRGFLGVQYDFGP